MSTEELYKLYCECGCRVTTDSRSVPAGAIFFALRGENFDGNDYALKALEAGAAYAVVNDDAFPSAAPGPCGRAMPVLAAPCGPQTGPLPVADGKAEGKARLIPVPDPFKTLQDLAVHHRKALGIPVIGLTGTNGKTTTKELITAALGAKFKVASTKGNLNNDIGVPLTLLAIAPDAEIAVVEMGANHPDDIAKLVKVSQPDYGYITNVGKAHLLGFGSYEGVLAAKTELYKWIGAHRGVLFLNTDHADLLREARKQPCHSWEWSRESLGVEVLPVSADNPFLSLKLNKSGRMVRTRLVGAYNTDNILAALEIAVYFGVPPDDAIAAIEAYEPSNKRSQLVRTGRNTLIVDAYNANPSSMALAVDNLAAINAESRLALLGDMRELGESSVEEHRNIVLKLASAGIPAFFVGEEFGKALHELAIVPGEDSLVPGLFHTSADLAEYIRENTEKFRGKTILVKGSRGIMMEKTIPEL